jgi:hypothetical protein
MQLKKLRKTIIILIIAFTLALSTIATYFAFTRLFTQNQVVNQQDQTSQTTTNSSKPQNTNIPTVNLWADKQTQNYTTATETRVAIPTDYQLNNGLEYTSGFENTLIFDKQISPTTKEYIQIDSQKNGANTTLEEKVNIENERVSKNTEKIYQTYTENVKGNIAATTIYRTIRPSRLVIRTIIYTPEVFHLLYVARDLNPQNDTLSTLTPELEKTKDALLQNYIISPRVSNRQSSNKEIDVYRKNMIYYRNNLK